MLIRKPEDVPSQVMTMPGAKGVTMRLVVGRTDGAPTFSMRHFEVEPHGHTPLHDHNYEHEVIILAGRGEFHSDAPGTTSRDLKPGDVVFISPNERHQFRNVGATTFKFMCMVPTKFDCGNGTCQATPGS